MRLSLGIWLLAVLLTIACPPTGIQAQVVQGGSKTQQILHEAAAHQKYTFVVFFKDQSAATKSMLQTVRRALEQHENQAFLTAVHVADPNEQAIVERFDVGRAPMPLTVAIAPNGAMTSVTPQKITEDQIHQSFVTPAMAHSMKAMQDNKLLFVCVQLTDKPVVPPGVQEFCNDPEFQARSAVMVVQKDDPAEGEFLRQLEVDPSAKGTTVVLLAPPAVVVGKFAFAASKEDLAAALHEAGKCCDDPNCKHNHGGQHTKASARGTTTRSPKTSGRRRP